MPMQFWESDLRGKKIVELDLRRAQTLQKFANSSRIHEDTGLNAHPRAKLP